MTDSTATRAAEHVADADRAATPAEERLHLDLAAGCHERIARIYRAAAQAV